MENASLPDLISSCEQVESSGSISYAKLGICLTAIVVSWAAVLGIGRFLLNSLGS